MYVHAAGALQVAFAPSCVSVSVSVMRVRVGVRVRVSVMRVRVRVRVRVVCTRRWCFTGRLCSYNNM